MSIWVAIVLAANCRAPHFSLLPFHTEKFCRGVIGASPRLLRVIVFDPLIFPDGEKRAHEADRANGVGGVAGAEEAEDRSDPAGGHARTGEST